MPLCHCKVVTGPFRESCQPVAGRHRLLHAALSALDVDDAPERAPPSGSATAVLTLADLPLVFGVLLKPDVSSSGVVVS